MYITKFLADAKLFCTPEFMCIQPPYPANSEEELYRRIQDITLTDELHSGFSTGNSFTDFEIGAKEVRHYYRRGANAKQHYMNRFADALALGSVASYADSRDVPYARVIFCDAADYDAGYLAPDAIMGRIQVRGRGGTVLQPGIDFLEKSPDFPKNGPILIITDAECDHFLCHRNHAVLIPKGARLPFCPNSLVFVFE